MNAMTHVPGLPLFPAGNGLGSASTAELIRRADAWHDAPPLVVALANALNLSEGAIINANEDAAEARDELAEAETEVDQLKDKLDAANGTADKLFDQCADLKEALRGCVARLAVLIEADNESLKGPSEDDVAAYETAREALAFAEAGRP